MTIKKAEEKEDLLLWHLMAPAIRPFLPMLSPLLLTTATASAAAAAAEALLVSHVTQIRSLSLLPSLTHSLSRAFADGEESREEEREERKSSQILSLLPGTDTDTHTSSGRRQE